MRRNDREVIDENKIDLIINNCDCCRLGFVKNNEAYILPLNFGFENENGKRLFYFHSATEGKKINLIETQPLVSFELDCAHSLNSGDVACSYSYRFQSVMGHGNINFVDDLEAKKNALVKIMEHYTSKSDWNFPDDMLKSVCVFCLEVTELSCKVHE